MNLLDSALKRPITIVVAIVAVILGSWMALQRMRVDILPDLGVPVIYVAQPYGGMSPSQMEGFIVNYYEYHFLYMTGVDHIESQSIQGQALMKIYFQPGMDMAEALADCINEVNRSHATMPAGTVPPFVLRFDAGSLPVGDLVFSSENRTLGELQDLALFRVRPVFSTLPGVSAPPPFGGQPRTIVLHVDPDRLRAFGMSPDEVVGSLTRSNIITPAGNIRIGDRIPMVPSNSVVKDIRDLETMPIRGGVSPVFLRDVGGVEDSTDIPLGYAMVNGKRAVYIPVTKRADASTLTVVQEVKDNLPRFRSLVPQDIHIDYEFDQSPYVTRAIQGLFFEGTLGAILTGLMVLLFLRDWRSVIVVVANIPLAVLCALIALWLTGQTVNIMSLGGLALAIGILVDEATVAIENIHTHLAAGEPLGRAVLDAGREVLVPQLLAMLCVIAVFLPSFAMTGVGRALFVPLALAVGFSMAASFVLSTTLVPVLSVWILKPHSAGGHSTHHSADDNQQEGQASPPPRGSRFSFEEVVRRYALLLERLVQFRWLLVGGYLGVAALLVVLLAPHLGTEIFPQVDTGQIRYRVKVPSGTRVEVTEQLMHRTLDVIGSIVGKDNVAGSLGFVGTQPSTYAINSIYLWTGGQDQGVMQVQLKEGAHYPVRDLQEKMRQELSKQYPQVQLAFQPADLVGQSMATGSGAPLEVAVAGPIMADDREFAQRIKGELARVPQVRDLQFGQPLDYPTVDIDIDRVRAAESGLTTKDIDRSLVAATSSSRFVEPDYWADPKSGVGYFVQVEVPPERMDSLEQIKNIPVAQSGNSQVLLRNVADVKGGTTVGEYDRYNMQRMITVVGTYAGEDLGSAAEQVRTAIRRAGKPPRGVSINVRGQVKPMEEMLSGLQTGLLMSVVVIFLLLAANFQSIKLSLITVASVPAAIAGVVVALWITRTTMNVQSFMGAIMGVGVAVANAILLVTFAEKARMEGMSAVRAAIEGARSRIRPILMTSAAMIAGMVPMSLALGEGGEQTAPLGRAVIGGLLAATFATLFILPAVFALVQAKTPARSASLHADDPESAQYHPETTV